MSFAALFFLSRLGVFFLQVILFRVVPLRSSASQQVAEASTEHLGVKDVLFIFINQFVETFFLREVNLIASSEVGTRESCFDFFFPPPFSYIALPIYSVAAALLLLFADDFLYEKLHALLHRDRYLYKFVHGHHHKATRPTRGYIDAINENPLEMIAALVLNLFAIRILQPLLTVASIGLFLLLKAIFAIINHLDRGFSIGFYSSERHLIHHSIRNAHYGQM